MRRFFAIVFPPLAVLSTGKIMAAFFNLILTLLIWVPGVIHAWGIVSDYKADKRAEKLSN